MSTHNVRAASFDSGPGRCTSQEQDGLDRLWQAQSHGTAWVVSLDFGPYVTG